VEFPATGIEGRNDGSHPVRLRIFRLDPCQKEALLDRQLAQATLQCAIEPFTEDHIGHRGVRERGKLSPCGVEPGRQTTEKRVIAVPSCHLRRVVDFERRQLARDAVEGHLCRW
jgi:hypothetical protein